MSPENKNDHAPIPNDPEAFTRAYHAIRRLSYGKDAVDFARSPDGVFIDLDYSPVNPQEAQGFQTTAIWQHPPFIHDNPSYTHLFNEVPVVLVISSEGGLDATNSAAHIIESIEVGEYNDHVVETIIDLQTDGRAMSYY